jgi:putative aldouronate transport system permease protein
MVGRKNLSRIDLQYTRLDRVILFVNGILLFVAFLIFLYPLLNVVSNSFSSWEAVNKQQVWLFPVNFTVEAYVDIFTSPQIGTGYLNSFIYTFFGTIINIVVTLLAAYPLSRKEVVGRGVVMAIFTFTMFFSGGMIPTFMVVRSMGLLDTRMSQMLPVAMGVVNVIIARTYFQSTIPAELYETAGLDGASDTQVLLRIVAPLSKPIIAVLILYYAVGHWNSFFSAMIYLDSPKLYPLQVILRDHLLEESLSMEEHWDQNAAIYMAKQEVFKYGLIVVGSLPVILLYPFIQKYFAKGLMIGSLKG